MGTNSSRIAPDRTSRIIDSQTRVRYQNQRELIQLRRKIAKIDVEKSNALSRLVFNQYDVRSDLHAIQHELVQRQLLTKLDKHHDQISTSTTVQSDLSDDNRSLTLECPSLLLHNLDASNTWEKSFVLPDIHGELFRRRKQMKTVDTMRSHYFSAFDNSSHFFEQSESFTINNNLTLKEQTELMKNSIRISIAKSARDSNIAARCNIFKH